MTSRARAIECKRVKAKTATYSTEQIGKIAEIEKACRQASGHVERGFHQVYLVIFAVVDGREVSGGHWLGGGLTGPLMRMLRDPKLFTALDPSSGIVLIELSQPVDKDIRLGGGVSLLYHRPATVRTQSAEITNNIDRLLAGRSS